MASAVQSLRLCLRASRRISMPARRELTARPIVPHRPFSATRFQRREDQEDDSALAQAEEEAADNDFQLETGKFPHEGEYEGFISAMSGISKVAGKGELSLEERKEMLKKFQSHSPDYLSDMVDKLDRDFSRRTRQVNETKRIKAAAKSRSFWYEFEEDPDLTRPNKDGDEFDENDITSMAHGKFEEYREYREYARLAAWQMPLLSKLAKPFEPPSADMPLRFRYTSYMGEMHPAENKVVVEFSPRDMALNEAQQLKLKKLLGARYNPETDIAKMSCEQFEHQAQNKRYLGDLVGSLIAKAKDPTDMFEDIPLDTRHHKIKTKPKFPKEWRMTEAREKQLDEAREKAFLLDQEKEKSGKLLDGLVSIHQSHAAPAEAMQALRVGGGKKAAPRMA